MSGADPPRPAHQRQQRLTVLTTHPGPSSRCRIDRSSVPRLPTEWIVTHIYINRCSPVAGETEGYVPTCRRAPNRNRNCHATTGPSGPPTGNSGTGRASRRPNADANSELVGKHRCTYRWIVESDRVLGGIALRHGDDDYVRWAGHVGYGIRPSARRRGLATWALGRMLDEARVAGLDRLLAVCAVDNVASVKTIERCGGVFEGTRDTKFGPPPGVTGSSFSDRVRRAHLAAMSGLTTPGGPERSRLGCSSREQCTHVIVVLR
jgi:RimJ/RimL family protein N-acetyltransferase